MKKDWGEQLPEGLKIVLLWGGVLLIGLTVSLLLLHVHGEQETQKVGVGESSEEEGDAVEVTEDDETGSVEDEPESDVKQEETRIELAIAEVEELGELVLAETFVPPIVYPSLQAAVDAWLAKYSHGAVGIEIFDVNAGRVVASYQATAQMRPRSIYKLFYLYDAYAQIDAGVDDPNQIYAAGRSLSTCLDIMVRNSDNVCAETMLNDTVRLTRVGQLIKRLGLSSTQADGLLTSAHDISLLLQYYYRHPEWSENSWAKFRETALNQSALYRRGLPSGFTVARVYDKAGWGGAEYNDAAMVELGGKRYIVVVLTTGTGYVAIRELGVMLEQVMLNS